MSSALAAPTSTEGLPSVLEKVRIVLVETSHPGNIGAAARAMKTMGLNALSLVAPQRFPCAEATARASGADDVLERAVIHADLRGALADCGAVVGTTARPRSIPWPMLTPEACAARLLGAARHGHVALVFGREYAGLTNAELELCQHVVQIPTAPGYASLNLAAAVQVLAYELRKAWLASRQVSAPSAHRDSAPATAAQMDDFYVHAERVMTELGFFEPENPRRLLRRLRRLFNRAGMDQCEINILRGFLAAVQGSSRGRK